jgi:ferric-dicitrate binding protein FerR (iron transport regulator)
MENKMKLEDLILNQSFCDFVLAGSKEDVNYWNNWIASHPENKEEVDQAIMTLKTLQNVRKRRIPVDKNESLEELLNRIAYDKKRSRKLNGIFYQRRWLQVAAMVLMVIVFTVVWKISKTSPKEDVVFTEIIVPIGEKAQVILSDNTHVWINSGSRFKYPVKYGSVSRDVFLDGEAYFDVTKQHGKPFIVSTKDIKIKVLGTAFNVKSYALDKNVETTVVRGLVKVESALVQSNSVYVNPNEKAIYVKENQQMAVSSMIKVNEKHESEKTIKPIMISKINPESVICWKDQQLVFTDETFGDMVVKMERWYNMKIQLNDTTLMGERYNGKFVHNETIYQVLEAIKLTTSLNYEVKNNIIIITRK